MEEGGESSNVLGTYKHRFNPRASFAFLHLLPIFYQNPLKEPKPRTQKCVFFKKITKKKKKKKEAKIHKTQISDCLN
ncbi:hypothetical protein TorRG33x02_262970 [Trema orientale]|uniref:Uncharacterized protein n=1 Tax=Trema orientale TaxID=63057 RepID=A0A2P5D3V5_TREOI|nr:hypothetical protein TorRG33x02_262970 [Trema orientale]